MISNKKPTLLLLIISALLFSSQVAMAQTSLDKMLEFYNPDNRLTVDAEHGKQLWFKENPGKNGKTRACTSCHGKNLGEKGKHIKSGKVIEPMAPSANSERFTKLKKVKKWFKRNCKWTYGRECTTQEKIDILGFLSKY